MKDLKRSFSLKICVLVLISTTLVFGVAACQPKPKVKPTVKKGEFSRDIKGLPQVKPTEIVELKDGDTFNLTASIVRKKIGDKTVKMLAYNRSIPGPLIKVAKGSEVTIKFTNRIDVETTVHSHGLRLDNKFDGVPDVTQKPIGIGKTFTYKIKFPDEGIYLYHPHVRTDYTIEAGLYGNYLVASKDENYWPPVNQEVLLMLDDILIENGKIVPFSKSFTNHALMGRFGNIMLINGETNYKLEAKQGEAIRFYITNIANTRTFNFIIAGAKMKVVGGDVGKYEREEWVDSVLLSPAERGIVEVFFEKPGTYNIEHKTPQKIYILGRVIVSSKKAEPSFTEDFLTLRTNQDVIADIETYRPYFDKKLDKSIVLTLGMKDMGNMEGMEGMEMRRDTEISKIEWEDDTGMMNANSNSKMVEWKIVDQDTGMENMDIDWKFKVGDKVKIKIFNDPKSEHPMQHPIHFHGQRFLVLSTNGVKNNNLVWKDTVLVQTGDSVEILLDVTNKGKWVTHCHITEHAESGMTFSFNVQ